MKNYVYIAVSLDGYIADAEETLDWLPSHGAALDLAINYPDFIEMVDGIVMGANTYRMVCSLDIKWPYTKPVGVVSQSISKIDQAHHGNVFLMQGTPEEIVKQMRAKGYENLYVDGGVTIQNFLKEDLIDEMIITTIPVLLGEGKPLFSTIPERLHFECVASMTHKGVVQSHFKRLHP